MFQASLCINAKGGSSMYTIRDYLQYYKNASIKDVHWNAVDNMLCAILVYLPLKSFAGSKSIKEFYSYAQRFAGEAKESIMVPTAYELLELMYDSLRYKNLKNRFSIIRWLLQKFRRLHNLFYSFLLIVHLYGIL